MMHSGPPKAAEAIIAFLLPPACREEVLGDLHERYTSPRQYILDGLQTVPLVIVSRIRRTADPQLLLLHAFALYLAFLGAAWLGDKAILHERRGLLRLAIPVAMVLLGLMLDDAYARAKRRPPLALARGPVFGIALALFSQAAFWIGNPDLAVPNWVVFYGCAMSLLLSSAIRILFPPVGDQLQGANAPALWLKQTSGSGGNGQVVMIRIAKVIFTIVALACAVAWLAELWKPR